MLEKIRLGLRYPEKIKRKARIQLARRLTSPNYETVQFLAEDWDTLLILDACRYDLFAEHNPFEATPKKVYSNASHTREFLEQNFGSSDLPDTVYVTASPQVTNCDASFAHVEHVWRNHWSDEHRTVLPEAVTDAALAANEQFPNKRLIVHYMQPHYPFIGPTGEEIGQHATFTGGKPGRKYASVWEQLAASQIDEHTIKRAYAENLELVLPNVCDLADSLTGKTVITSDHGNLFGKRVTALPFEIYGHPRGVHDPELTAVPWLELPYEERRTISSSERLSEESFESDEVDERLRDLGYV
ncbi:hypothetical protein [Halorussus salinisoli]|uniref:hypothetical protein n=1 Tax=Halorussus salinisoli TaxID=2558242 RepID=UPI0010C23246|nr:hypothetical protein [Halorussus salinisoli]